MGILDTALQKLSNPSANIAMAEDTFRDTRNRMYDAMNNNANRAQAAFDTATSAYQKGQDRAGQMARLDKSITAEQGMQESQQRHESAESRLDRLHQTEMAETEREMRLQLQELQNEHEQLLQTDRQTWTSAENELDRALRWKIAQLEAQLRREGIAAQNDEDIGPDPILENFVNEMSKIQQTNPNWLFDVQGQQRFSYQGELTPEVVAETQRKIIESINRSYEYTEQEKAALIDFVQNRFYEAIEMPSGGGDDGGGEPHVWAPQRESANRSEASQTIEALKNADLSPEDRSLVEGYAETMLNMRGPNLPTDARANSLENLLELLAPLEEKYLEQDNRTVEDRIRRNIPR